MKLSEEIKDYALSHGFQVDCNLEEGIYNYCDWLFEGLYNNCLEYLDFSEEDVIAYIHENWDNEYIKPDDDYDDTYSEAETDLIDNELINYAHNYVYSDHITEDDMIAFLLDHGENMESCYEAIIDDLFKAGEIVKYDLDDVINCNLSKHTTKFDSFCGEVLVFDNLAVARAPFYPDWLIGRDCGNGMFYLYNQEYNGDWVYVYFDDYGYLRYVEDDYFDDELVCQSHWKE